MRDNSYEQTEINGLEEPVIWQRLGSEMASISWPICLISVLGSCSPVYAAQSAHTAQLNSNISAETSQTLSQFGVAQPNTQLPSAQLLASQPPSTQPLVSQPTAPLPSGSQSAIAPLPPTSSSLDSLNEWQKLTALGSYGNSQGAVNTAPMLGTPGIAQPFTQPPVQMPSSQPIPVMVDPSRQLANSAPVGQPPLPATRRSDRRRPTSPNAELRQPPRYESPSEIAEDNYQFGVDFIMHNTISAPRFSATSISGPSPSVARFSEATLSSSSLSTAVSSERISPTSVVPQTLFPGTSANGKVTASVAWATDMQATATGMLELTEDLRSNNTVVVPAGTQLVVALRQPSRSGMMDLAVTSMILPEGSDQNIQIPPEAVSIRGAGGQALVAKTLSSIESHQRGINIGQVVLGAVSQASSLLSAPSYGSGQFYPNNYNNTYGNNSPNIWGSMLSGGLTALNSERANLTRRREEDRRMENARHQGDPSVWVLEVGTDIELFVTQAVALRG